MDVTGKEDWQEGIEQIPGTSTFNGQVQEDRPVKKTKKEPSDRRKIKNKSWTIKQGKSTFSWVISHSLQVDT